MDSIDSKLDHGSLLNVAKMVEPAISASGGLCYAGTSTWLEAVLTGEDEEDNFYESFDEVRDYIKQKSEENILPEKTTAFLKKMARRQNPKVFSKKFILQYEGHTLQNTLFDYKRIGMIGINQQELKNYLLSIESLLEKQNHQPCIGFMLGATFHAIGLYFHIQSRTWSYFNINMLYPQKDYHFEFDAENASKVTFFEFCGNLKENYLPLSITTISKECSPELIDKLTQITNSFLTLDNRKTSDNQNCFWLACYYGNLELIQKYTKMSILENINTPVISSGRSTTPVHIASENGHVAILKLLFENGAKESIHFTNEHGQSSLFMACMNGHDEIVQFLLENDAKTNAEQELYVACLKGHTKIVSLLLNTKKIEKKFFGKPLYVTCEFGHEDILQLLINNGAKTNLNDELYIACQMGHASIVGMLLTLKEVKDNINTLHPETKITCLWVSCLLEHHDIIKLLLENGAAASINILDMNDETPLSIAIDEDKTEVINLLSQYLPKNDDEFQEISAQSPLMIPQFNNIAQKANLRQEDVKTEVSNKMKLS